ncbi:IPT/TIG domain-containing protein [Chloroflexota bacterium]
MKYRRICRMLAVAMIFTLLILAIPVTPALAAGLDISPSSGEIDDNIDVYGYGFTPGISVYLYFTSERVVDGDYLDADVTAYERVGVTTAGAMDATDEGEIDTNFDIPEELTDGDDEETVRGGTYYIFVTYGGSDRIRAADEFTVEGVGEITIDPDEGNVGDEVEITGEGFGDEEELTIEYDGDDVDIESGDDETDNDGDFECTIIIPESTAGDHTITVIDDSDAEAEATFTVEPQITISPTSGEPGTAVTVSGTGFGNKAEVTIYLDNDEMTIVDADRDGTFEDSFEVLELEPGIYNIEVEDDDDNSADKEKFTVTVVIILAEASLNPTTGNIGTELTVSGTGFTASGTVTVKYDNNQVATTTADANGAFSATFTVPKGKYGEYAVTVSGGTNTKNFTFTMESDAPPVPAPLKPEMDIQAESPINFDWKDVTDPSGVTYTLQIATDEDFTKDSIVLEKTALTKSEYTLTEKEKLEPLDKKESYYWRVRAIDDASNMSGWSGAGSFHLDSTFSMPQGATYALFGLGALLLGALGFWMGRKTAYF